MEGHELEVIGAGMKLLQATQPRLLIEMAERHRSNVIGQMVKLLGPLGYRGCFIAGPEVLDITEYDPARHQRPLRAERVAGAPSSGYVNNFIFLAECEREQVIAELQRQLTRRGVWLRLRHGMRH